MGARPSHDRLLVRSGQFSRRSIPDDGGGWRGDAADGYPGLVDDYSNFSPDGSVVVFQRSFVNQSPVTAEILVIDVATGEERCVTDNADWDSTPSFSSDGELIIFESNRTGSSSFGRRVSMELS